MSRDFTRLWTRMFLPKYGKFASLLRHSSKIVASTDDDANFLKLFKSCLFVTHSTYLIPWVANIKFIMPFYSRNRLLHFLIPSVLISVIVAIVGFGRTMGTPVSSKIPPPPHLLHNWSLHWCRHLAVFCRSASSKVSSLSLSTWLGCPNIRTFGVNMSCTLIFISFSPLPKGRLTRLISMSNRSDASCCYVNDAIPAIRSNVCFISPTTPLKWALPHGLRLRLNINLMLRCVK